LKTNTLLWTLAGLLLLAVAGLAAYKAWPLLFPEVSVTAVLDPDCDLRAGACSSVLSDGARVSLSIEPRDLPVVKPLSLTVTVEGLQPQRVEVDFSGVDMNMGLNRAVLESRGEGLFHGKGMLPVCVSEAMEWEAKVLLHTRKGLVVAPYRFITVRPGVEIPGAGN
jgi:hypothetical protein